MKADRMETFEARQENPEIWDDGKDMVENVWGEAFKYKTDSTKSYVWKFDENR